MSLPRLPLGTDVYMTAKIKDSDIYLDWGITPVDVYVATADELTVGTVVRVDATPNGEALDLVLTVERQQLLNIAGPTNCRLIFVTNIDGKTVTYKVLAFTFDPDINEAVAGTPDAPVEVELSVGSASSSSEILALLAECRAALDYLQGNEVERIENEQERARRWAILEDSIGRATTAATTAATSAIQAAASAESAVVELNDTVKGKQDSLISGENIKTINGESILGGGNIQIQGGGEATPVVDNLTSDSSVYALSARQGKELKRLVDEKQDKLVSGTNIKTINGQSITGEGNIDIATNAPDEEDLTSENGLLKIKNRSSLDGMGYVILRKNKSFAEQVTHTNTIYEIRHDFSVPSNFSIPEGCKFFFNGGNVIGGSFVGNLMNSDLDYVPNMTPSIIQCMPSGSIVRLHADIAFSTIDPVDIKCNIHGNGHEVSFSSKFSYFNVIADNVTISDVRLVNNNTAYDREARVVRCDNHSNLTITKCFIGAGVTMYNHYKDVEIDGLTITDNIIDVDYSERLQDTISQADVFYILGIKNVLFARNRGKVKNICRFFKIQDAPYILVPPAPDGISNNASENIVFENNYIVSECGNGKQFLDMYNGSVNVVIRHNIIKATGHTMIFEDKTNLTFHRDSSRRIDIYDNEIWYDSSLMLTLNNIKGEQVYFNSNVIYNTSDSITRGYMENGVEITASRGRMLHFTNTPIVEVCNNKFFNPYDTITGYVVMKNGTSKSIKFNGNYVENYAGVYHFNDTDIVECNENYFANSGNALLEVSTEAGTTALVKSIVANNNTIGSKYTLIDNTSRVTINKIVAIGNTGNTQRIVSSDVDNLISDGVLLQTITGQQLVIAGGSATTSRWLNNEFIPTRDKLEILITGNVTWTWQLVVDTILRKFNFQFANSTDAGQYATFIIKHYVQRTI